MISGSFGGGALALFVPRDVGHDRKEPRLLIRARLEPVSISVGSQIRFLHKILGVFRLSGKAQRASIQRIEMPFKKRKIATHANATLVHSIPAISARRGAQLGAGPPSGPPPRPPPRLCEPPGRGPRPRPRPRRRRRRFGSDWGSDDDGGGASPRGGLGRRSRPRCGPGVPGWRGAGP